MIVYLFITFLVYMSMLVLGSFYIAERGKKIRECNVYLTDALFICFSLIISLNAIILYCYAIAYVSFLMFMIAKMTLGGKQ